MAQPLQYIPQFVPTNFNTLENVLGMYRQDLGQRDEMFDQSAMMREKMISELYNQETLDPDVLGTEIGNLSSRLDDVVSKYSGDYAAAAKDIARLGVKEMANPIYNLNRRKVEQAKMLDQMLARNPNLYVLKDPRTAKLSRNLSADDLGYEVADPATIQEALKQVYGELGNRVVEGGLENVPGLPGMLQSITTKGLTRDEVIKMQQDEGTYNTLMGQLPQLQKYADNPQVLNWFKNQVNQGLMGLEGGSQRQYVSDPSYMNPLERMRMAKLMQPENPQIPSVYNKLNVNKISEDITNEFSKYRSLLGKSGNFDEQRLNRVSSTEKDIPQYGAGFNPFIAENRGIAGSTGSKAIKLKEDYKNIYDSVKKSGGTDKDFIDKIEKIELEKAMMLSSELGFDDYDINKDLKNKLIESLSKNKAESLINVKDPSEKLSIIEIDNRLKDSSTNMRMNARGELLINLPDKKGNKMETYKINPKSLPDNTNNLIKNVNNLLDIKNKFNLSDKELGENPWELNKDNIKTANVFEVNGGLYRTAINPNNLEERKLVQIVTDESGNIVGEQEVQYENLILSMYGSLRDGLNLETKKQKQSPYEY